MTKSTNATSMKLPGFIATVNKERIKNPKGWVFLIEMVEGKMIRYKAYGTWIQRMTIEGCEYNFSTPMNLNVGQFKTFLEKTLTEYL